MNMKRGRRAQYFLHVGSLVLFEYELHLMCLEIVLGLIITVSVLLLN